MVEHISIVPSSKVSAVLKYEELIETIESSFRKVSDRQKSGICQPIRTIMHVPEKDGFFAAMPAFSPQDGTLATKLVTFYPQNKDVATHNAVIMLFDSETGLPQTLMDGDVITTMRTAAASAVATKYLAPKDSKTLAIIGAGTQGMSHFHALSCVCPFQKVLVWNRHRDNAETFAAKTGATVCSTVEEAVSDADVIVTATSSPTPVIKKEWVKSGAHINAVGACRPDWHEMEPDLVTSSVVYADTYEGGYKESGDIVIAKAEIFAELGEVILGKKEARREETTIFKSLGLGIQDAVSAKLVMEKIRCEQK